MKPRVLVLPVAAIAMRAATAAAEPPEEPPGTRWRLSPPPATQGFVTDPKYDVILAEPMANSSRLALPNMTVPPAFSLPETVLS